MEILHKRAARGDLLRMDKSVRRGCSMHPTDPKGTPEERVKKLSANEIRRHRPRTEQRLCRYE